MQSATAPCKKNINDLHIELGHPSKSITNATTKAMGIQVMGTFKPCKNCTLGKAKWQGVSKKAVAWSKTLGERLFFDISSPLTPTFGGKKHWLFVVDDSSNYVWSFYLKEKSNVVNVMSGLTKYLKNKYNLQVQYLHCDNAGENVAFKKACKQEGLGLVFKYTVPGMPQQNGYVEQKIATHFNWVCAMLNGGKFNAFL